MRSPSSSASRRFSPLARTAPLLVASLAFGSSAFAVGTRVFELDTLEKLSGGDLKGVAVSSDGHVRAGFTLGNVPLPDASAVYAALTLPDGSVLVGTSSNGKIIRVNGDQATVYAETKETAVTSLALGANGTVYAGTIPDGTIFKVVNGKAEKLAKIPEVSHVWALAWDKTKSALYDATGDEGKVVRVTLDGSTSVYFTSDEPNLVSLAVADDGVVYAGSQGKGLLYRITGPGRASVVYDFPGEEVKGIALGKDGAIFAIANEYGELPEVPHRSPVLAHIPAGPNSSPRPKPGKGALYAFDAQLRPEKLMHHDEFHYVSLALGDDGRPYVGTGAEGRVYTVDEAHVVTLVADTDERQIGALSMSGPHPFVVAGDPAVFHRVLARGGSDAVWTSKVLDAGLRAKFGAARWTASGPLEVSTRTGDTQAPDATWSPWSNPLAEAGVVPSPSARFIQVRARWRDATAVLSDVTLPFVTENVRPIVLEVSAAPKSAIAKEPTKENLPASGGEPPKHETTIKLTWRIENPDEDALRYHLSFRRQGDTVWRDVLAHDESVNGKTEYEWDTSALPEGRYSVRVVASDEPSNPPGDVLTHTMDSSPFVIDNTPPVLTALSIAGRVLRARAVDGVGPIIRIEVAVDGKLEWRPLGAKDGVFDSADESVDADVSTVVPPGSHVVTVRAFDAAGNAASREVESR